MWILCLHLVNTSLCKYVCVNIYASRLLGQKQYTNKIIKSYVWSIPIHFNQVLTLS